MHLRDEMNHNRIASDLNSNGSYYNRLRPTTYKAIIFSQFREHIVRVGQVLEKHAVKFSTFFGGISRKRRDLELETFRNDPDVMVLLLSDLGAHGLDLPFVTHMFLMDEIWDHSLEEQVVARAHRMGATTSVQVEQLIMKGTVEVLMQRMAKREDYDMLKEENRNPIGTVAEKSSIEVQVPGKSRINSKRRKSNKTTPTHLSAKGSAIQRRLHFILGNLRLIQSEDDTPRSQDNDNYSPEYLSSSMPIEMIDLSVEQPSNPAVIDLTAVTSNSKPRGKRKRVGFHGQINNASTFATNSNHNSTFEKNVSKSFIHEEYSHFPKAIQSNQSSGSSTEVGGSNTNVVRSSMDKNRHQTHNT